MGRSCGALELSFPLRDTLAVMALRHVLLVFLLLLVALPVFPGDHYYLAWRLVLDGAWSKPLRSVLLGAITLLSASQAWGAEMQ